jgi:hypothetical protein
VAGVSVTLAERAEAGTGSCGTDVTLFAPDEAVWAVCLTAGTLGAPDAAFVPTTSGANAGAEYRDTMDPAETNERATYGASEAAYVMVGVGLQAL